MHYEFFLLQVFIANEENGIVRLGNNANVSVKV